MCWEQFWTQMTLLIVHEHERHLRFLQDPTFQDYTLHQQEEMKYQVTDILIHRHSNQPAVSVGNYYPWCWQLELSPKKL